MSAIAGIYNLNGEPVSIEDAQRIMSGLRKYPADDIQTWHNEGIFLGCHAQWITPESVGERLPYHDVHRRLTITADAIIDNREELFERLSVDQVQRKNMPDSQLILLAYNKWGEDAPKYLIGDFAFIIWDENKHQLFGARDFSGSRTLYFFHNPRRFAFCTVMSPLFTLPYIEKNLNEQWLAEFLAMPDITHDVLDPALTVYQNIEQLPPAHTISVTGNKMTLTRYCKLVMESSLKLKSNEEYEEAFCDVFDSAVTSMTRTHRQVGAQLSGGLDSGSVVSFAAQALRKDNKKLHTFSYVPGANFKEWTSKYNFRANERPLMQSTVQYVGNITDHYFSFEGQNSLTEIDDWIEILEMPYKFFENSFWVKGIHEEASRQGVGVLLSGQRGNLTISRGKALVYYALLLKKMSLIRLFREINHYSRNIGLGKVLLWSFILKNTFPVKYGVLARKASEDYPLWINEDFAKKTNVLDKIRNHGLNMVGTCLLDERQLTKKHFEEVVSWEKVGMVGTKLSLRYSLWNRDPTNDLRVIRFCLSVPEDQFVQQGIERSLIRRSTVNRLPDNVRLNRITGLQSADVVYRIMPSWSVFIEKIEQVCKDSVISQFLNVNLIKAALSNVGAEPRPEYVFNRDFKILARSLIFYRFIKNMERR